MGVRYIKKNHPVQIVFFNELIMSYDEIKKN